MRPIDRSVQIFMDLGWDAATREDAATLPLGTKDQQRTALAGLQKGTPRVDVDLGMLGMFAILLGVDGRRAAELAKGSDQALLDCLLQRDEKFALAFAERACWLWANADSIASSANRVHYKGVPIMESALTGPIEAFNEIIGCTIDDPKGLFTI